MTAGNEAKGTVQQAAGSYVFLVSFVATLGGFLFGYDLNIIGAGMVFLQDQFLLNDVELGFATSSGTLGCIFGPALALVLGDKYGRRDCLFLAATLFAISAIGTALPKNMTQFNMFRMIGGVGIGFSSVLAPMYIAEIAPADRRGRLVLMYQLAITLGAMLGSIFALLMARNLPAETSWRWMFGSEVFPIVLFVIFLQMVPQSPRWLSEKGRYDDALAVLTKINGSQRAEAELAEIKQSIDEESGTFAEVFSPGLQIALLVAVCLAFLNNWTGWSCVAYYMPILFQKAGFLSPQEAIVQSVTLMVLNTALTFVAIALVDRWGRKSLWVTGSIAMIVSTIAMACIFNSRRDMLSLRAFYWY